MQVVRQLQIISVLPLTESNFTKLFDVEWSNFLNAIAERIGKVCLTYNPNLGNLLQFELGMNVRNMPISSLKEFGDMHLTESILNMVFARYKIKN